MRRLAFLASEWGARADPKPPENDFYQEMLDTKLVPEVGLGVAGGKL
jgi:hypothetical protein